MHDLAVRDLSYGGLVDCAARLGVLVQSAELPGDIDGVYDDDEHQILIDSRVSAAERYCALVHEIVHALHRDRWRGDAAAFRLAEIRTRAQTAKLLIDPLVFEQARQECRSNDEMAAALGVTVSVLGDYWRLVLNA